MTTETRVFEPNAVLIPADAVTPRQPHAVDSVDPEMCTLLYLDGDRLGGYLFEKEEWEREQGGVSKFFLRDDIYYHSNGDTFCRAGLSISDQEPVQYPHIELLPDMWVLKVDETQYWNELKEHKIKRVFGVYVLNKRKSIHLCEVTPSYELHRFDSQFEQDWEPEDANYDRLNEAAYEHLRVGDGQCDSDVIYMHCSDVETKLKPELRERQGDLPDGPSGGFKLTGLKAVTEENALEEIRERFLPNGEL